jgi:hypothetical protein
LSRKDSSFATIHALVFVLIKGFVLLRQKQKPHTWNEKMPQTWKIPLSEEHGKRIL